MRLASTLFKFALGLVVLYFIIDGLMPWGRHPDRYRSASCQSNLKQMALCFKQYMQDYDERSPSIQTATSQGWVESLGPYTKKWPLFHCAENPNKHQNLTDYFYNAQLSEAKLKSISFPTSTILAGDGNYDAPLNTAIAALPQGWRDYNGSPAYRHRGGANYAFVDGHVKWFKVEKITLESPKKTDVYTFLPR